jgi:hypothetical protein
VRSINHAPPQPPLPPLPQDWPENESVLTILSV